MMTLLSEVNAMNATNVAPSSVVLDKVEICQCTFYVGNEVCNQICEKKPWNKEVRETQRPAGKQINSERSVLVSFKLGNKEVKSRCTPFKKDNFRIGHTQIVYIQTDDGNFKNIRVNVRVSRPSGSGWKVEIIKRDTLASERTKSILFPREDLALLARTGTEGNVLRRDAMRTQYTYPYGTFVSEEWTEPTKGIVEQIKAEAQIRRQLHRIKNVGLNGIVRSQRKKTQEPDARGRVAAAATDESFIDE